MRKKINGSMYSLSFEKNTNVDRAKQAVSLSLRKFIKELTLEECTFCFNEVTQEVLFFIPFEATLKLDLFTTKKLYFDIEENFKNAGFEVIDDKLLRENTFPQVTYASRMYKLRSLK